MALSKVQSMMKGGKSIDALGSLYDDAFSLYGKFEGAADFQGRHRSLELVIVNGTSYDLEHVEEYFATGTSYEHIKSVCIEPGTAGLAFVTNRQGKWEGVCGSMRFAIKGTKKYLIIGFTNPECGCYKTSIQVCGSDKPVDYGYEQAFDDKLKNKRQSGFHLVARLGSPKQGGMKLMEYQIMED